MPTTSAIAGILVAGAFLAAGGLGADEAVPLRGWNAPAYWAAADAGALSRREAAHATLEEAHAVPTVPLAFVGIPPCRVADTRDNSFPPGYGPPSMPASVLRNFKLHGRCGIPATAEAVSFNFTVTNTLGAGFLLVYPADGAQATVSTLNYLAAQTVANAAVVPLGTDGNVTAVPGVAGFDLIMDVNGYYAPQQATGGVASLNGLSGAVTLEGSANVTVTPSGNTLAVALSGSASGDLAGTYPSPVLTPTGVTAGPYGATGAEVAGFTVDAKGRITNAATRPLAASDVGALAATATAGGDLTGTFPSPALAASAVTTGKIADGAVTTAKILDGTITNADVATSAAIAWSKVSKTGAVAADIGALGATAAAGGDLAGSYPGPTIASGAVTAAKIAPAQVVKDVNGLRDSVTISGGAGISVQTSADTVTIGATAGSSPKLTSVLLGVVDAGSGFACTLLGSVQVTATGSGTVLISGEADIFFNHSAGENDEVVLLPSLASGDCPNPISATDGNSSRVALGINLAVDYHSTVPFSRVFTVASGATYTFYLNSRWRAAGSGDQMRHGKLTAIFFPD